MWFICYPKCSTCSKAKNWLESRGIAFEERNIKEAKPTAEELQQWHRLSGLPLKSFFNTSGLIYRSQNLKERIPTLAEEQLYQLLASDGMLVKRPILVIGKEVLVGFKEKEWSEKLC